MEIMQLGATHLELSYFNGNISLMELFCLREAPSPWRNFLPANIPKSFFRSKNQFFDCMVSQHNLDIDE